MALLILLLIVLIGNVHAVTFGEAQSIYKRVLKSNNIWIAPRLKLVDYVTVKDDQGRTKKSYNNAATGFPWQYIYVTKQMLKNSSADQMGWVLSHELGHAKNYHKNSNHQNEYTADKYGKYYAGKAGYNSCSGSYFLKDTPASSSHPAGNDRRKALGC